MPSVSSIAYYLVHPNELRSIIQWKTWHNPVHERDESKESADLKECFRFLQLTSRSFSAVIQELHPELLVPVCLFYLILRGLDTVEDDMSIPLHIKEPMLRDFHNHIEDESWTFDGNGPDEKDRELLVHFDVVAKEFNKIKAEYRKIIKDITTSMGNGMADYAKNADHNANGVQTIKDYELYCHYVAGLVGEGLTRLFVEAKLANPALLQRPELMESMGQFLQQTNIIRDIREDHEDKRYFWPKEVWSKYVTKFSDLFLPENREKALQCSSEMVLIALNRADECLFYMAGVKEQSVFNFVAIPQSMAIATLELCFQNEAIFDRNIKITKGSACQLMTESTQNLQLVCEVFRRFARKIHRKNKPSDPHFLDISVACGKIERFIESIFPTQTPRTLPPGADQTVAVDSEAEAQRKAEEAEAKSDVWYLMIAIFCTLGVITFLMIGAAWFFGARFDLAFAELRKGNLSPPKGKGIISSTIAAAPSAYEGHNEL
ncbi:putative squalene synthase [Fulvia fulva]|uniref:Squalene synthase n=1 Tax=Passalora fulva TaxID=5499 RepID=A0A9Q8L7D0_PASFU|nr:putative squalene synthase [Fulvia fulva]KAK4635313.1 putative squalene synthase [Fulvia fulva]KAK4636931.1 putative squalene synthase [Fulvia fulva]UJO12202.1 putative squalene synthase [Fulvia fulva]WPV09648.1 putative squalene synthase [Fulvia fulva]WPV25262.1 putative squalene synthase [Fulvia fulva]